MTIASGIQQLQTVFKNVNISATSHSEHVVIKSSKTENRFEKLWNQLAFGHSFLKVKWVVNTLFP